MSSSFDVKDRVAVDGRYFFLSYAHSPPLAGTAQADPDRWVRTFFHDLADAVSEHADNGRPDPGFFDKEISLSEGWKTSIKRGLSLAEVFVPLLSPGYYTRSWPGKEWTSFDQRLARTGLDETEREQRFEPVLWIPLPGAPDWPGLSKALALGADEPAYAENGLRTLLRLAPYRASYERIVDRLAKRIVVMATSRPLAPSEVPSFDDVSSPFLPMPEAAVFGVYVASPNLAELPPDRDPAGYGQHALDWRAFPSEQELPLAEYAEQVAEQLDFTVAAHDAQQPVGEDSSPGIVLVDPWVAANPASLGVLRQFAKSMPSWILPMLVLGSATDPRANELADRVRAIFSGSAAHAEPVSLAINGVKSLKDFVSLMPDLVTEAQRRYLRRDRVESPTAGQRFWPRLTAGPSTRRRQEAGDD